MHGYIDFVTTTHAMFSVGANNGDGTRDERFLDVQDIHGAYLLVIQWRRSSMV